MSLPKELQLEISSSAPAKHVSTDWSDKADTNSGEWLFTCYKWLCTDNISAIFMAKEAVLQVNNRYRHKGEKKQVDCSNFQSSVGRKNFSNQTSGE